MLASDDTHTQDMNTCHYPRVIVVMRHSLHTSAHAMLGLTRPLRCAGFPQVSHSLVSILLIYSPLLLLPSNMFGGRPKIAPRVPLPFLAAHTPCFRLEIMRSDLSTHKRERLVHVSLLPVTLRQAISPFPTSLGQAIRASHALNLGPAKKMQHLPP